MALFKGAGRKFLLPQRLKPLYLTSESARLKACPDTRNCIFKARYGIGRSVRIIQDVPNLSLSMAKRGAKKVSSIFMKI